MSRDPFDDIDDQLAHTRMSFGDHIEELRTHLWRALIGFAICLGIGFVLDSIGASTGLPIGLGKPVLEEIKAPVETAMKKFYKDRADTVNTKLQNGDQKITGINESRPVTFEVNRNQLREAVNLPKLPKEEGGDALVPLTLRVPPVEMALVTNEASQLLGKQMTLTTLSVQEAFVVYFKVSIVCGIVISSPWLAWQFWSFVGAGLYQHERRYVYKAIFPSVVLFLTGVFLCQWVVLPNAVQALLEFNRWIGLDPDLRLSEWLGFALILPLVFGLSFQTPLVMLALERIGIVGVEDFRKQRKIALFVLAILSAILTPTPDVVTMLWLWVPMYSLYEIGILVCAWAARNDPADVDAPNPEEPVGV